MLRIQIPPAAVHKAAEIIQYVSEYPHTLCRWPINSTAAYASAIKVKFDFGTVDEP